MFRSSLLQEVKGGRGKPRLLLMPCQGLGKWVWHSPTQTYERHSGKAYKLNPIKDIRQKRAKRLTLKSHFIPESYLIVA